MCGIVGLFLKNKALEPDLGAMLATMLATMSDRGPDSAGFAIYGAGDDGHIKLTLRSKSGAALDDVSRELSQQFDTPMSASLRATHLVLTMPRAIESQARAWLAAHRPDVAVVGTGTRMELYKEVGLPSEV
ncbi:MAG TPA: glutamine amidotransferase, partial [Xanthobacteraceae bacterium]